ncbi:MAG: hypothetical protein HS105_11190 [Chloracidobacterium sp.]|nr:hypothetical protein [Chloracidobacterium sp.]MCO5332784.1 hypothetical protein [Pyrinomonadaceae bacterium]
MGTAETLDSLVIGSRLLVRSRTDWRFASVARRTEEDVIISVCSPTGYTYRLRRSASTPIEREGPLCILPFECDDTWHDNLTAYDTRW